MSDIVMRLRAQRSERRHKLLAFHATVDGFILLPRRRIQARNRPGESGLTNALLRRNKTTATTRLINVKASQGARCSRKNINVATLPPCPPLRMLLSVEIGFQAFNTCTQPMSRGWPGGVPLLLR